MKYILFILLLSFASILNAQTDTTHQTLKRGFYRDYKAFLANSPTKLCDYKSTPIFTSKVDSTLIGTTFKLNDTVLFIRHEWGYCDGKDVYINLSAKNNICTYWKLMQKKPYPFFLSNIEISKGAVIVGKLPIPMIFHNQVGNENIIAPFLSGQSTVSSFENSSFVLDSVSKGINSSIAINNYIYYLIDEEGKPIELTNKCMKKALSLYPDLLKSYNGKMGLYNKYLNIKSGKYDALYNEMVKKTNIDYLRKIHDLQKQIDLDNKDIKE